MILSWESFHPALNCNHLGVKNNSTRKAVARHAASTWNLRYQASKTPESCPDVRLFLGSELVCVHVRVQVWHVRSVGMYARLAIFISTDVLSAPANLHQVWWSPQRSYIICVEGQCGRVGGCSPQEKTAMPPHTLTGTRECPGDRYSTSPASTQILWDFTNETRRRHSWHSGSILLILKWRQQRKYLFSLFSSVGLWISVLFSRLG